MSISRGRVRPMFTGQSHHWGERRHNAQCVRRHRFSKSNRYGNSNASLFIYGLLCRFMKWQSFDSDFSGFGCIRSPNRADVRWPVSRPGDNYNIQSVWQSTFIDAFVTQNTCDDNSMRESERPYGLGISVSCHFCVCGQQLWNTH